MWPGIETKWRSLVNTIMNLRILMDLNEIGLGLESSDSGLRPVTVCCEHSNKLSVSIENAGFVDWTSDC
jgi:hypothetical protein